MFTINSIEAQAAKFQNAYSLAIILGSALAILATFGVKRRAGRCTCRCIVMPSSDASMSAPVTRSTASVNCLSIPEGGRAATSTTGNKGMGADAFTQMLQ
jgi:hypothetical protein